jgi:hypothetical protein
VVMMVKWWFHSEKWEKQNQHVMIYVNKKNRINRMFLFCDDYSFWWWFYIKKNDQ